jgi:hypothetical protein
MPGDGGRRFGAPVMPSLRKVVVAVIVVQSALGFIFLFYGSVYSVVNTKEADEMIEYVRINNPGYYEKIISEDDETFRKLFYKNFTEHGNRPLLLLGIFFIVIAVNVSVPFIYFEAKRIIALRSNIENAEANTEEDKNEVTGDEAVQNT